MPSNCGGRRRYGAGVARDRRLSVSHSSIFVTTFLTAAVEVIEMVIIVVGVGTVRGWRSTWLGAATGLAVLPVLVLALGTALTLVPRAAAYCWATRPVTPCWRCW